MNTFKEIYSKEIKQSDNYEEESEDLEISELYSHFLVDKSE